MSSSTFSVVDRLHSVWKSISEETDVEVTEKSHQFADVRKMLTFNHI